LLWLTADVKDSWLVEYKNNQTLRGRVVNGRWTLDKKFDFKTNTMPHGVIYVVKGAGG